MEGWKRDLVSQIPNGLGSPVRIVPIQLIWINKIYLTLTSRCPIGQGETAEEKPHLPCKSR